MLNKLITAVRDIDKATSPFAYDVSTFDVTPPGAAAIINNPTASSGDIGQTLINKIATKVDSVFDKEIFSKMKIKKVFIIVYR